MARSSSDVPFHKSAEHVSVRLYIDQPLVDGGELELDQSQANYLFSVLRLNEGAEVAVFNGVDGEWACRVRKTSKKAGFLVLGRLLREQTKAQDLWYIFAPIKRARLDYMVQKAVELGVSRLTPVITQHTNVERVKLDRMNANAIEAAEQCEILSLPEIDKPVKLANLLDEWDKEIALVFCDEAKETGGPIAQLESLRGRRVAVIIGPEGGFSSAERDLLRGCEFVTPLSLGPRIMRADTAAVAALSLVNAVIGDWQN